MQVKDVFLPLSRLIVQLQGRTQGLVDDIRRAYYGAPTGAERSTFSRMVRDLYPYVIEKKFKDAETLIKTLKGGESLAILEMLQKTQAAYHSLFTINERPAFEARFASIRAQLKKISVMVDEECQRITAEAQMNGKGNLYTSMGLALLALIFGVFTVWFGHKALSPLPQLIESLRKISDGDFNQSLKVKTTDKDEVALLAREFNRMLGALQQRDRKIAEQQGELVQAERLAAIGQLSAEIVHEIRNPLNSISLNIDWLSDQLQDTNDENKSTLKSISREIERLNVITESYLVRARVNTGRSDKTNLNELLNEIVSFSKEEHRRRKISVDLKLADRDLLVRTERSKLKQAFLNVFRNAAEAMPNGGRLSVRSELSENVYEVVVSDTGYGMNESTRNRTFRPFFTTKQNGTGLGLMLTKSIVEEAQGTVDCSSKIGQGTVFRFKFPA